MAFGDTCEARESSRLLDAALASGIASVDTANGYARGRSEELLGQLLGTRRAQVVLATKVGIPHADAAGHAPLSAVGVRACLEGSLRRLRTDHVELLYLHQPDRTTPLEDTLTAVADLIAEGKVEALGVSNYAAWQIAEINALCDQGITPRPVVAQQVYSLVARRIEAEYLEFAATARLRTMVFNPLAGGLLAVAHTFEQVPERGRFGSSALAEMYRGRYWNRQMLDAVRALNDVASRADLPLAELALRWVVHARGVDATLLGASHLEQLEANIAACENGPLPADVLKACDEIGTALNGPMPAYNR
jgi:aryl-alcohol dehydrogenase-like predicted oxidoreductase